MLRNRMLVFHEEDTIAILKRIGLYDDLENGNLKCAICGTKITEKNIGGILRKGNRILVICDKLECLEEAEKL